MWHAMPLGLKLTLVLFGLLFLIIMGQSFSYHISNKLSKRATPYKRYIKAVRQHKKIRIKLGKVLLKSHDLKVALKTVESCIVEYKRLLTNHVADISPIISSEETKS